MAELTPGGFFAPPPSNIGYARTPSKIGLKKTKENRESASKILKVFQDVRKDTENLDLLVCIKDKSIHVEDKEILLRIHYGNQIFCKIKSFFEKLAGSCVSQPLLLWLWKLRCDELEEQSASSQNMSDSDFLIFNTFFINGQKSGGKWHSSTVSKMWWSLDIYTTSFKMHQL